MKYRILRKGKDCPKCLQPMERRAHKEGFTRKKENYYFFKEWDYCKPCKHLQHYEEFKVTTGRGSDWEEIQRQTSFLRSLQR